MSTFSRRSMLGAMAGASLVSSISRNALASSFERREAEFSALPSLDATQSGYLRHFSNIAAQMPSDFTFMQSSDPDNIGDFDGYRWQLKSMMDSMILAHQNYLPAAPGVFKVDYDRLLNKLLRRECWNYWREMSRFSVGTPPPGVAPGEGWWDPLIRENIFYSGLLTAMVAQYAYFFNNDKFDRVGSLSFERPPYAKGPVKVEYSLETALDAIYWQLVENGYLGVACQPGMVFNSCPQMAIQAFAYQDRRKGTGRAEEIIAGHRKGWEQLGGYKLGQPMPVVWKLPEKKVMTVPWELGYFVFNTWNPEYFRSTYAMAKATATRKSAAGRLEVYAMAQYAESEKAFLQGKTPPAVRRENRDGKAIAGVQGTVAVLLSEAGDPDLDILLKQVDAHMNPTWVNGGLYYPRLDQDWDEDGNVIGVAPTSSHAYALARINKRDGLHELFSDPLAPSRWDNPYIAGSSREVDLSRAVYLSRENKLVVTLRPPHGSERVDAQLSVANVKRQGQGWTITVNGHAAASGNSAGEVQAALLKASFEGDRLKLNLPVSEPTDLVVSWT